MLNSVIAGGLLDPRWAGEAESADPGPLYHCPGSSEEHPAPHPARVLPQHSKLPQGKGARVWGSECYQWGQE